MKAKVIAGALAFLALFSSVLSCGPASSRASANHPKLSRVSSTQGMTEDSLMALVMKFAAGVENEQAVFQEIGRYPQTEIVEHLTRLLEASREDTQATVSIAFLLCNLDHNVVNNKKTVVETFVQDLHTKNAHADWEAELLRRLIKKGHNDLLPVLFNASELSDGALSQSLSSFFLDQLRETPQDFLIQLSRQPKSVRQAVYSKLAYGEISLQDLSKLVSYVNSVSDSNLELTGREIIAAIHEPGPK